VLELNEEAAQHFASGSKSELEIFARQRRTMARTCGRAA
jgi:hypothetical protein